MIKRFRVSFDHKNNTERTKREKGHPEINFEDEIAQEMNERFITDDDIISITTTNGITFDVFYKTDKGL